MKKISKIEKVIATSKKLKEQGKSVGLITGSFDVCRLGHLNLFRFAKQYVDFLIVGLDHDETVKKTKGKNRPLNSYEKRSMFLSDLITVDKVFLIEEVAVHGTKKALNIYKKLLQKIKPTHIFTHKACDRHWKEKEVITKKLKIKFFLDTSRKVTTSGEIIQKLEAEL